MFINERSGASKYQFGLPSCDRAQANFLKFDKKATLQCLTTNRLQQSLQGRLLSGGMTARTFNILDIEKPLFIENFFVAAVDSVSRCERKRSVLDTLQTPQPAPCEIHTCDTQKGVKFFFYL